MHGLSTQNDERLNVAKLLSCDELQSRIHMAKCLELALRNIEAEQDIESIDFLTLRLQDSVRGYLRLLDDHAGLNAEGISLKNHLTDRLRDICDFLSSASMAFEGAASVRDLVTVAALFKVTAVKLEAVINILKAADHDLELVLPTMG